MYALESFPSDAIIFAAVEKEKTEHEIIVFGCRIEGGR